METHVVIKNLRLRRGLSQDQLAHLAGYSDRSSIAKIEAGEVDLPQSKIALFAKVLNVSPAELMGFETISGSPDPEPADLTPSEWDLILAYRAADDRTRALVDLALDEYMKKARSEVQAG